MTHSDICHHFGMLNVVLAVFRYHFIAWHRIQHPSTHSLSITTNTHDLFFANIVYVHIVHIRRIALLSPGFYFHAHLFR